MKRRRVFVITGIISALILLLTVLYALATVEQPLPTWEMAKLDGVASGSVFDTGTVYLRFYNGSDWRLRDVSIRIAVLDKPPAQKNPIPGANVFVTDFFGRRSHTMDWEIAQTLRGDQMQAKLRSESERRERQPGEPTTDIRIVRTRNFSCKKKDEIEPFTITKCKIDIGDVVAFGEDWTWEFAAAQGAPVHVNLSTMPVVRGLAHVFDHQSGSIKASSVAADRSVQTAAHENGSAQSLPTSPEEIAKTAMRSVVVLEFRNRAGGRKLGTGFFVGTDTVITNFHVCRGATAGSAKLIGKDGEYKVAGLLSIDEEHDLALLKITGTGLTPLPLAAEGDIRVGQSIYVIGNPLGLEGTFSAGNLSSVREVNRGRFLQITAPISPGSSGGPVLDNRGRVIGVTTATLRGGQNLNFAVPVSYLMPLLRQQTYKPLGN